MPRADCHSLHPLGRKTIRAAFADGYRSVRKTGQLRGRCRFCITGYRLKEYRSADCDARVSQKSNREYCFFDVRQTTSPDATQSVGCQSAEFRFVPKNGVESDSMAVGISRITEPSRQALEVVAPTVPDETRKLFGREWQIVLFLNVGSFLVQARTPPLQHVAPQYFSRANATSLWTFLRQSWCRSAGAFSTFVGNIQGLIVGLVTPFHRSRSCQRSKADE